ncbi:MAG: CARDB domain-containing protein, partial [Pseudomonadota bacterium]
FTRLNEPAQARIEREGYLPVTIEFQADSRERIECGNIEMTRDPGQAPDLRPLSPGVEPNITVEGAAVTTSVFVSNVGDEASGATNVNFVASDDPVIDLTDPVFATVQVPSLAAGAQTLANATTSSPIDRNSLLYVGACVTPPAGEQQTDNNCFGSSPLLLDPRRIFLNGFEAIVPQVSKRVVPKSPPPAREKGGQGFCNIVATP